VTPDGRTSRPPRTFGLLSPLNPPHDVDLDLAVDLEAALSLPQPELESGMRIGVLGTGMVGSTIGSKLVERGHEVMMGSRTRDNDKAVAWARKAGERASQGAFEDVAQFGDVLFNCTSGTKSLAALEQAGADRLGNRILIDVSNPLSFVPGELPTLTVLNTDSLGEQIQRAFPELRVVKTLNTLNTLLMINPGALPGDHNIFMSGNDADAKTRVGAWLSDWFGWKPEAVIDLGDITTARGAEMVLPLWLRLMVAFKTPMFNFHIVRAPAS
jgi:8-hydroxy-5-deazaflavin:NADPH oxidoreductase